jgi:hypothetical protein
MNLGNKTKQRYSGDISVILIGYSDFPKRGPGKDRSRAMISRHGMALEPVLKRSKNLA